MGLDDVIELFNPGHKHLAEERDRKRIEAQLPGSEADDDPSAATVDLDRGVILLPPAAARQDAGTAAGEATDDA